MNIALWTLLAFAVWTLLVLMAGVGLRRWALILGGRAQLTDFPGDAPHGSPAYRRAVRAHANCVENLPVYGAIVVTAQLSNAVTPFMEQLAVFFMFARICQTVTHMAFSETNLSIMIRFLFFLSQIAVMSWMAWIIAAPNLAP